MDGTMDVDSQIRLMRTVIGRKYMEIDDFIDKCGTSEENSDNYDLLIDFLKNDIRGYKTLIDELQDGADLSGNYGEISSVPERVVGIYNDIYLASLKESDLADEQEAMAIKTKYASDLVRNKYVKVGKAALDSPLVLALMSRNIDIAAVIGKIVLSEPELINALNDEMN